jgi:hypothetical protein
MHLWRPLAALLIGASGMLQAAVVYKWTDASGVVHYSDQPVPGAEKITTQSTLQIVPAQPPGAQSKAPPAAPKKAAVKLAYEDFAIESPTADQTFFSAPVTVRLRLRPALDPNHMVSLQVNGATVADLPTDSTSFSLSLPRGAYSIVATITDRTSTESMSTDPVTFFVQQATLLSPLRK